MLATRFCALDTCGAEFQTDNPRKIHCSTRHSALHRKRRARAKGRKGGGGGGNGGGGGESPTLFDTITPVDSKQAFVVLPIIGPDESERKPSERVHAKSHKAAA